MALIDIRRSSQLVGKNNNDVVRASIRQPLLYRLQSLLEHCFSRGLSVLTAASELTECVDVGRRLLQSN